MNTRFLDSNLMTSLGSCKNLHGCLTLSLSVELFFLRHRPFNTSCTVRSTSNMSRILVHVTLVGGGTILNSTSNVVELQQHSPSSETSYVHRMIITPPYLFKYRKNDGRVSMLFQWFLGRTQQKLYYSRISLLTQYSLLFIMLFTRLTSWESACNIIAQLGNISTLSPSPLSSSLSLFLPSL